MRIYIYKSILSLKKGKRLDVVFEIRFDYCKNYVSIYI